MAKAADSSPAAKPLTITALRRHAEQVHSDIVLMADKQGVLHSEDIHGLRVASKELRALWQLLKPLLDKAEVRKALANLEQAASLLSDSRDHQVAISTLQRLRQHSRNKDARGALDEALAALQAGAPDQANQRAVDLQPFWQRDQQYWQALNCTADAATLRKRGFDRLYNKAAKLARAARCDDDIRLWHKLRKWVKYLALTLPLQGTQELADELGRLGKKLGRLHDLHQLLQRIEQLDWQRQAPQQAAYVKHLIRREEARLCQRCADLSSTLFAPSPAQFIARL